MGNELDKYFRHARGIKDPSGDMPWYKSEPEDSQLEEIAEDEPSQKPARKKRMSWRAVILGLGLGAIAAGVMLRDHPAISPYLRPIRDAGYSVNESLFGDGMTPPNNEYIYTPVTVESLSDDLAKYHNQLVRFKGVPCMSFYEEPEHGPYGPVWNQEDKFAHETGFCLANRFSNHIQVYIAGFEHGSVKCDFYSNPGASKYKTAHEEVFLKEIQVEILGQVDAERAIIMGQMYRIPPDGELIVLSNLGVQPYGRSKNTFEMIPEQGGNEIVYPQR